MTEAYLTRSLAKPNVPDETQSQWSVTTMQSGGEIGKVAESLYLQVTNPLWVQLLKKPIDLDKIFVVGFFGVFFWTNLLDLIVSVKQKWSFLIKNARGGKK